ncbi:putative aspartyl aminopeptidase [Iris pallida]|uniref:Aspartyl aminopeptidase n=1 Tax=Iris pallida TaxID=29817 RepID=A0AAX6ELL5_IRIPA|nr:putative aspartyl aminopeptidase [Iris pallida]KAJ6805027.1 putative aspartyl aminopeptidase [Iris pallida]KAJ6837311.1 putative aspartyl aminopeptidase [Iris pallida]KAJ6838666.1 putative aspartyl aminopeptidase [Iris pallida]KAJ6848633.1 putative aspartyl aminopeptidase [Iris pallida]
MTNRGRRRLRGGSSRPTPSTPEQQIGGASEDDVIMADDGLPPQPTPSSVGGTSSSLPSGGTPTSRPSGGTSCTLPSASMTTEANMYPGLMFLPNGAYYRRPGCLDPPTPPERPANETRIELWPDGKAFFPLRAGIELGELIRGNFHGPYLNFRSIPEPKKYIWLDMLRKSYWWPDHREIEIKKCYKSVAGKRLGDMVSDQKSFAAHDENKRKDWLKEEYWKKMKEDMAKPEYKIRSDRAKAARAKAGLHTGGSIPTSEHFRRMCEEAAKAGLDTSTVDFPKIFERTHKRRKDGKLVDERASKAFILVCVMLLLRACWILEASTDYCGIHNGSSLKRGLREIGVS